MSIPFAQFLMPDGRRRQVSISRPPQVEATAQAIRAKGYRFEIEVLTTGEISMEILKDIPDPDIGDSLAIEICANGPTTGKIPGVPETVDKLIAAAAAKLKL